MVEEFKDIECIGTLLHKNSTDYPHLVHLKHNENNINQLGASLNSIIDCIHFWNKNFQRIHLANKAMMEESFEHLFTNLDNINGKIEYLQTMMDLTENTEIQTKLNILIQKLEFVKDSEIPDLYPTKEETTSENKIPNLYYGTEHVSMMQISTSYNYQEFRNIVEILDYWRTLYKDPDLNINERNHILKQICDISIQYNDLLAHFNYQNNDNSEDEEELDITEKVHVLAATSSTDSETNSSVDEEIEVENLPQSSNQPTSKNKLKRSIDEPLDPEFFGDWNTNETTWEQIQVGDETKTGSSKTEPHISIARKDDLNKTNVAQGGTYLDLTHVPFKDQGKVINDWAQSLSILVTNYKNTWAKEKFLD